MLPKIRCWFCGGICNFAFLGRWWIQASRIRPLAIDVDLQSPWRCPMAWWELFRAQLWRAIWAQLWRATWTEYLHMDRATWIYFQNLTGGHGNAPWRTTWNIYIYIYCFSFLQVRWTRKYKTRDGWSTISIGCVSIPITRKIEILNNIPDFHRGISVSTRVPLGKVASGKIPETLLDILPVHQREVNFRRPLQLDTFHGISQRLLACCCAWIQWASFFWEKNLRTLKGCQLLVKLLAFSQEAWKKDALFAQMQVPLAQPQRDNAAGGWNCPVCNNYNYAIRTTKRD